ncbi:MAG: protoheme IX farnesyltransferase [Gammaproteobacteria bacterium]|nr:protoheme IX farnesyltransferase [Gammaproteobacteria bacterium]
MKDTLRDYLDLTKPRITVLILVCTAVGYWFSCGDSFHWPLLVHALLGTALLASGTSALNQWYEADSDSKMRRTRLRPIAAGRITGRNGFTFGVGLAAAGFADLWFGTNPLSAALGLFTLLSYLLLYTPLKRRSPLCTTVGAIPGAMPPLIGYAAAGHGLDGRALALFLILFIWQFPHFDAIAWMYREDYARGGIRMLPVIEPDGESTARRIMVFSLLLIPISLTPVFVGMTGAVYATAAIIAGLGVLYFGSRLGCDRSLLRARALLLATVIYLPVVLSVMVLDRRLA